MSADNSNYKDAISRSTRGLPNWYFYLLYINGGLLVFLGLALPLLIGKPYTESLWLISLPAGLGSLCFVMGLFLKKMQGSQ